MFNLPVGLFGVADGSSTRPTNTEEDMSSLAKTYAEVMARNRTPNGRVARGFDQFGPQTPMAQPVPPEAPPAVPALPPATNVGPGTIGPSAPQVSDGGYNAIDAQASNVSDGGYNAIDAQADKPYGLGNRVSNASAYMRDAADTPTKPQDFFSRNTAMMRDPMTGDFLDPQAGSKAQATGPDLIHKFMTYLHNK